MFRETSTMRTQKRNMIKETKNKVYGDMSKPDKPSQSAIDAFRHRPSYIDKGDKE